MPGAVVARQRLPSAEIDAKFGKLGKVVLNTLPHKGSAIRQHLLGETSKLLPYGRSALIQAKVNGARGDVEEVDRVEPAGCARCYAGLEGSLPKETRAQFPCPGLPSTNRPVLTNAQGCLNCVRQGYANGGCHWIPGEGLACPKHRTTRRIEVFHAMP